MIDSVDPASFRDPYGFVFRVGHEVFRQINLSYRTHYDHLMRSGLHERLVGSGLLVRHEEMSLPSGSPADAYKIIQPHRIRFLSYPYEWCFSQLKAAALATLRIQEIALQCGMSLRDASAYNIQFEGPQPVLIDTLSFELHQEGRPWLAYKQFCEHFLAPLVLMAYRDARLSQLLRSHLSGIPLDLAVALTPLWAYCRPSILLHLRAHLHAQLAAAERPVPARAGGRHFSHAAFRGLLDSLRRCIGRLRWRPARSSWEPYYPKGRSYSDDGLLDKQRIVAECLDEIEPHVVWDLGSNTGLFSRLASRRDVLTIAFDSDPACVEACYKASLDEPDRNLLPLLLDVTNPSPALGWAHRERLSLAERGPADLILALALIHHLAIGNNVPLDSIADFLAGLGPHLVIEFVPRDDVRVQTLLATRDHTFPDYGQPAFEASFGRRYEVLRAITVAGSRRIIYLMRTRH